MAIVSQRVLLADFALANPLYSGASLNVFVADVATGLATTTRATLYRAPSGSEQEANPCRLDGDGKLLRPVYVDVPVVARVTDALVPAHDTGVLGGMSRFRGVWEPNVSYQTGDTVRDGAEGLSTFNIYIAQFAHRSSDFETDLAAGRWSVYLQRGETDLGAGDNLFLVTNFGAVGDGVTDDTAAIQAAADAAEAAGGGVLYIPPGHYITSSCLFIGSGTIMRGAGMHASRLEAAPWEDWTSGPYSMVRNRNHNNTGRVITDENITVEHLFFDYSNFGTVPGGGAHAVGMRYVRNVRVQFVRARDGENLNAFLGCEDTLVFGCHATGQINCPYDQWAGAGYARVIGNFCDVEFAVQVANFNGIGDGLFTQTSSNIIISGNQFISRRTSNPSSISLAPLGTASATRRIIISGNDLTNVRIATEGNTNDVLIDGNLMRGVVNGASAIQAYGDGVTLPARWKISNNIITDMATQSPSLAVIDYRGTDASVTGNIIKGGAYNWGVRFAFLGVASGNDIEPGTSGTISGPYVGQTDDQIVPNNKAYGWRTTTGNIARFRMQSDDNFVFLGTGSGGGQRTIASCQMDSDTSPWRWSAPQLFQSYTRHTVATVAAAGTTISGATEITSDTNNVTSCTAGVADGVSLFPVDGQRQTVINSTADTLKVYPNNSGSAQIDGGGASVPVTIAAGKSKTFTRVAAGDFRTVAAT